MAHVFNQDLSELSPWILAEVQHGEDLATGSAGPHVRRAQEWLSLHGHGVVVDGDFGPATERAVQAFQNDAGLIDSGQVDEATFTTLVTPMIDVLRQGLNASVPIAQALLDYADAHLSAQPREVGGPNSGPWVRLYMSGREGGQFAWCAGFVTFLLDQAAQSLEVDKPIAGSVSCDVLAAQATRAGTLLDETAAPGTVTPGSIFLVRRIPGDWTHTGVITAVAGDTFDTIEGNTNDAGHREGTEVCARTRAYPGKDFILL
ncbi:peptidoglycan-binding domain-containing protein [Actinoplanes sp. NPDC051633]|uniref:peptidoglycan-binding domain-containing protein n=1 Tax=Actinoplanes sp. NPDC051633 TaxID=3155670 RepID=UPI0034350D10